VSATAFAVRVEGKPGALGPAQAELERWVDIAGLPPRAAYQAQLVFEELATNSLKYGCSGGAALEATVELHSDELVLIFRDSGEPFDPTTSPEHQQPASIREAPLGGLGLDLVRKSASSIAYRRDGDQNVTEVRISL
jgi:serine/threonine-protein kinase RsbW